MGRKSKAAGPAVSIEEQLTIASPALFAKAVSEGAWKLYPHLRLLDRYLMMAISGICPRLIIQMPPQHGKSQLISEHLPVWYLGHFPDNAVMLCSYEADYAQTWGLKTRQLMERVGPTMFGVHVSRDSRRSDNWCIDGRRGIMQTSGINGPVTGKKAHLLIIDDPVKNNKDANSPTMRENNKDWMRTTSSTRLQKNSVVIVVQTRWHEDDLAGWLQSEFPERWLVVNLPAIAWGPGDLPEGEYKPDPLGRKAGEALCPQLHPVKNLAEKIELMGEAWFSALYQGRPVTKSGGIFNKDTFKYWTWNDLPEEFDHVIQSWDMTFKDTSDSDWVVGQIWGMYGANRYLLAQFRNRISFPETVKAFKAMTWSYFGKMSREKLIEMKANGPAVKATLDAEIPGIEGIDPEGSKEARAHAVSWQFSSGNVYFPDPDEPGNEWVVKLISEFHKFPKDRHDDQVDAATQALAYMYQLFVDGKVTAIKRGGAGLGDELGRAGLVEEKKEIKKKRRGKSGRSGMGVVGARAGGKSVGKMLEEYGR
jgi:predicted phage terminase large subunit-like protein